MIEFKCEHCGKALHLDDSYGGRDGWCRECKQMVIVPIAGQLVRVADLSKEEGYERLQRLLQYAATKADKFKLHLAQRKSNDRRVATLEEELRQVQESLAAEKIFLHAARDSESLLEQSVGSVREETSARIAALESSLEEATEKQIADDSMEKAGLELALTEARGEIAALQTRCDEHEATLAETQQFDKTLAVEGDALSTEVERLRGALSSEERAKEAAEVETARLVAQFASELTENEALAATTDSEEVSRLMAELATLREHVERAEADKQNGALAVENHASSDGERSERLESEIRVQASTLETLRNRHEERDTTTREQIYALEEQVVLFDELKERMASLQNKVGELDQARLDLALALEESDRLRALETKKNVALESNIQGAAEEKASFLVQLKDLQRDCTRKNEQVKQLNEELQILADVHAAAEVERDKERRLLHVAEERSASLVKEMVSSSDALDKREATRTELERKLATAEARQQELAAELAAEQVSTEQESLALRAAKNQVSALERALEEGRDSESQHSSERERLANSLVEAQGQIASLKAQISEGDQLAESLVEAEDRIASLRAQISEGEQLAKSLAEAEDQIASLDAQMSEAEQLENSLAEAEDQIASLKAQLSEGEQLANSLAEAENQIESLKANFSESDSRQEEGPTPLGFVVGEVGADKMEMGADTADAEPLVPTDNVSDQQRHVERQKMMDVLSDFLDK